MVLLYAALCVGILVVVLVSIPLPADRTKALPTATVGRVQYPRDVQDVLVGTLRNPGQLDICLQHGFYHIPCCQVEDTAQPIRYIAIYQSVTLFASQAGIRYYGQVSECVTVPRYRITQIYSESNEPYFVFRVGEWKQLPAAVAPKETAFVSARTSLFALLRSAEVPQLWTRSREEFALYEMLRKAAAGEATQWTVDMYNCTVRIHKKRIQLLRGKKQLWSCTLSDFNQMPNAVMRCLRKYGMR